jgi:hypothetical protein
MNSAPPFSRGRWLAQSLALFIPFAAILHNTIFFRPTCMLKPFGLEYDAETVAKLVRQDPSVALAAVAAVCVCVAGLKLPWPIVRAWVPGFLIGFAPLSLWIWDVPFAGRPVCRLWHDERLVLPLLGPVHSRHLYILGLALFVTLFARRFWAPRSRTGVVTRHT